MAARGYTNALLVAQEMGRALSGDEAAQVAGLVEEAEAFVDAETGRSWLVLSPVTETHVLTGPYVSLAHAPVVAVTSATVRPAVVGGQTVTLTAGSGYDVLDADAGLLLVGAYPLADAVINTTDDWLLGGELTVTYTFTSALPADLRRAATLLVASWLLPRTDPAMVGASSVSVGQGDLAITYNRRDAKGQAVPDAVERILRNHRRVAFA